MYPRTLSTSVLTGSKDSIALTPVTLVSASTPTSAGVTVKASVTNTNRVYIGTRSTITPNTNAALDGFEMAAGESVWMPVNDAIKIYVVANASGQRVFWMAP